MPPRHPSIAQALGAVRSALADAIAPPAGSLPGAAILAAVSGGPDSIAMLGLLELLAPSLGFELAVGHVDHRLRPESGREADGVARLARSRGHRFERDTLELDEGPALPARARAARLAALDSQAQRVGARFIALGHTATDQVETMLMHMVRGAGLGGIAAMASVEHREHAPIRLRPVLGLTRAQTRELAGRMELEFVDDPTNLDRAQFRIDLRESVLPVLRTQNPRLERAFMAASDQARDADQALAQWAERETHSRGLGDGRWSVDGWSELPRAVRLRLLRHICVRGGAEEDDLAHDLTVAIDGALCRGPEATKSWDLHRNLCLRLAHRELRVEPAPHSRVKTPNH